MLYNVTKRAQRLRVDWQIRDVLNTPPIQIEPAPWTIVSMVGNQDVKMYLIAIKTFYARLGRGDITAIISKDMKRSAIGQIFKHIPGIKIEILQDINVKQFQSGGTWERLVYIMRLAAKKYVIQLDCDTISVGVHLDEILERVNENMSFAYSDGSRKIESLKNAAYQASEMVSNYVGIVLERSFSDWYQSDVLRYCRASSAITGFAKGSGDFDLLNYFNVHMKKSLGSRWQEWGTEQCASNFMIANAEKVSILPFPEYCTYSEIIDSRQVKIYHFIGSIRYKKNCYAKSAKKAIKFLKIDKGAT